MCSSLSAAQLLVLERSSCELIPPSGCLLAVAKKDKLTFHSVFSLISTVIFSVMLYRHRKAGGHSNYNKEALPAFTPNTDVGGEKIQMQAQSQPYSNTSTPAPQQYYQPPPQQNTSYAPVPTNDGQQYHQLTPQYPQQMPQQLGASPAPTYNTPVQSHPQQQ
jgi:hypothetical protein